MPFIAGSNSYLLSGELMTKLTGRYIEFEMFPLSFEEYEDIKKFYGKKIEKTGTPISEATIARYIKALLDAKILYECPRFDMKSKKLLNIA